MRVTLLNMVFGSVSFWCVRCLRYTACPEGVPSRSTRLATEQDLRKGPQLAGGRSPHFEEARRQIVGRRACVRRAGVLSSRHAERRQKGAPEGAALFDRPLSWCELQEPFQNPKIVDSTRLEEERSSSRSNDS